MKTCNKPTFPSFLIRLGNRRLANQVTTIKTLLGLNREISSASVKGNLGDAIRDLRAELADVKAQIQVLNKAIENQGPNQGV